MSRLSLASTRVERLAVLRALHLGDLLLAVPAFRSLRAGFPNAEITLITLPWARSLVARFGAYLDRYVEFPGFPGINERKYDWNRLDQFFAEQRAYAYDLGISLHGSGPASTTFIQAIGAERAIGYYRGDRPPDLALAVPYPDDQPEVFRNLNLVRLLGCPERGQYLEFPLNEEEEQAAETLLRPLGGCDPLVVMHPGARPSAKRWPPERFAVVADHLADTFGTRTVLVGGTGEEGMTQTVARRMKTPSLDLAGGTSLGVLAAVIRRAGIFIGNDSGPAHLACAVDTPSVTIFGPVEVRRWRPLDEARHRVVHHPVWCSPCAHWDCPMDHRCLRSIEAEQVIDVVEALFPESLEKTA